MTIRYTTEDVAAFTGRRFSASRMSHKVACGTYTLAGRPPKS